MANPSFNWSNWSDNATNNTGTSITVGATGSQGTNGTINQGDLLIACVIVSSTSTTTDPGSHTWPIGWTRVVDDWNTEPNTILGDFNYHYSWAWKIATAGETASYSVSWTNAARGVSWVLFDYIGAVDVNGNADATTASTTSMVAPSISPIGTSDIELIIGLYGVTLTSYTLPGGFTQRANVGTTSGSRPEIIAGDIQLSVSGATGTKTITTGSAGVPSAIAIGIKPIIAKWQNNFYKDPSCNPGTTVNLTTNSNSILAGDLLIAIIGVNGTLGVDPGTISLAGGWTQISNDFTYNTTAGNAFRRAIFYRIAGASEPSSYAASWSVSQYVSWALLDYGQYVIDVTGATIYNPNSYAETLAVAPSITPTTALDIEICIYMLNAASGGTNTLPATLGAEINQTESDSAAPYIGVGDIQLLSSSATATQTMISTDGGSGFWMWIADSITIKTGGGNWVPPYSGPFGRIIQLGPTPYH